MWLVLLLVAGTLAADFTNDFAVRVAGGEEVAELVAASHGCHLVKRLGALDNVFHFVHPKVKGRSKRSADDILHKLLTDPNVDHVEQQRVLSRHKRATVRKRSILHDKQVELPIRHVEDKSSYKLITPDDMPEYYKTHLGINFTDPFFAFQWYLINRGQTGSKLFYDINVLPVWQKGITGKGQVVSILDDGIDHTHSDLAQNYDPQASADLNDASDSDNDPMPNVSDSVNSLVREAAKNERRLAHVREYLEESCPDFGELEHTIAKNTIQARQMFRHCLEFRKEKVGKVRLIKKLLTRNKNMRLLRRLDYDRFLWMQQQFSLDYCDGIKKVWPSRADIRRNAARDLCKSLQQQKLEQLKVKLAQERTAFLKHKEQVLAKVEQQLKELGVSDTSDLPAALQSAGIGPIVEPLPEPPNPKVEYVARMMAEAAVRRKKEAKEASDLYFST